MRNLLNFVFVFLTFRLAAMEFRQPLDGSTRQFRQAGKNEWHPASVPGRWQAPNKKNYTFNQ